MNPIKLTLCMIVRDEADNLGECLDTIDTAVDEIVIVDTGSIDNTVEIARNHGAKVHLFPWIDDFAAARNESIRHAKGSFIIWLDADDRLEPKDHKALLRFKEQLSPKRDEAYAFLVSCRNLNGEAAVYYQVRVFPNREGINFEGAVHENLVPSLNRYGIEVKTHGLTIVHTGYKEPGAVKEKLRRNLQILKNTHPAHKRSHSGHYYMAQCCCGLKDYRKCVDHLILARQAGKDASFYKPSYTMLADAYLQLDQGEMAIETLRQAVAEFPASGYLCYLLGSTLALTGNYAEALPRLEQAAQMGMEVENAPVLAQIEYRRLYYRARCLEGLGRMDEAAATYTNALEGAPYDIDILRASGLLMVRQGQFEEALQMFETARRYAAALEIDIWLMAARLHFAYKNSGAAEALYTEILAHDPDNIDAGVGLIRSSLQSGNRGRISSTIENLSMRLGVDTEGTDPIATQMRRIVQQLEGMGERENASVITDMAKKLAREQRTVP